MRIVLVAEEAAGVQALRAITARGHEPVAVLTSEPGQRAWGVCVADVARAQGYPVWPAERVTDAAMAAKLANLECDLLLNVHSLYVIDTEVLAAASIGSFNLHPGPLPTFAGMNAPSWAVYRGEPRHAVTLHWMYPGIDTGPIAYEYWFDLDERATGISVSTACARHGIPLIERLLDVAAADPTKIPSQPQDLSRRRLFLRRDVPFDGRVRWSGSAMEIIRYVRASDFYPLKSPWGHPLTFLDDSPLGLIKVRATKERAAAPAGTVVRVDGTEAWVAADDYAVALQRVVLEGRLVAAADVLEAGMRLR